MSRFPTAQRPGCSRTGLGTAPGSPVLLSASGPSALSWASRSAATSSTPQALDVYRPAGRRIALKPDLPATQAFKTLCHEAAHTLTYEGPDERSSADPANPTLDWTELTNALSEPFEEYDINCRAGTISRDKKRAQALRDADHRVYDAMLNALVPSVREVEFEPWGEKRIICRLTIHWVTRSSTCEKGNGREPVAGTAAKAQPFKRTRAKADLGSHLRSMEVQGAQNIWAQPMAAPTHY